MKKLISTSIIAIAVIIALTSCTKQQDLKQSQSIEGRSIVLNIDSEIGTESLSALGFDDAQLRALQFDLTGSSPKIKNSTNRWKTHLFLRKQGEPDIVGYVEYYFDIEGLTPADRQGKRKIKLKGATREVTIHNITSPPKAGEVWYVIGILGGGKLDESKTKVDFLPEPNTDRALGETEARVPVASVWTKLSIDKDNKLHTTLAFKPQGVIINVAMTNNKYDAVLSLEKSLLTTSSISNQGHFDFSASQNPENQISSSQGPKWIFADKQSEAHYPLSTRFEKGKQKNQLIWGMPTNGANKITVEVFPYSVKRKGSSSLGFVSTEPLVASNAYRINLEFDRPKIPLEYVADYNLAGGSLVRKGTTLTPGMQGELRFAGDHLNNTSGYYDWYRSMGVTHPGYNQSGDDLFTHEIAVKDANGQTIRIPLKSLYHIPSLEEWRGIFGDSNESRSQYGFIANASGTDAVTIRGVKKTYKSETKSMGTGIGYAIRLMDASGAQEAKPGWSIATTNDMKTAYRYERVGDFSGNDNNSRLKVKSVYLGAGFSGNINTIADESWWQKKEREGLVVTREFSASGAIRGLPWGNGDLTIAGSLNDLGRNGLYLSSTEDTANTANFWSFHYNDVQAYGMSLFKHEAFAIRPFLNY